MQELQQSSQFYAYVHARPDTADASGIFYVGKGKGRRSHDFLARNYHHGNVIGKYGEDIILVGRFDCSSEELALDLEKGLIKALRRAGVKLTNMTEGGEGISGYSHTEEARMLMSEQRKGRMHKPETLEKMSKAHISENNHFYGKNHTEESKLKISVAKTGSPGFWLGKTRDPLTRAKISEFLMGKPGRPHTDEAKTKISTAQKGRKQKPVSEETRKKLSQSSIISWSKRKQLQQEK